MSRLDKIQRMLQADPDDVFLNFSLAMEYVKDDRPQDALMQFERVTEVDAGHVSAYYQWANVLVGLKRNDKAREVLDRGIAAALAANDGHMVDKMTRMRALLG
ncbi:MAG TPA: tetratricopeptide repeat protein [Phycisphaerae bacterium]|nr:tetratricopeptide repeat protein [Phycisphaerae bacterium]